MRNVLYLHGFCSSSGSAKGVWLAERFQEIGVHVELPDLDEGDFEHSTLTRQLALVDRSVEKLHPAMVIGSSLGGYLAALHAARHPGAVPAITLLAPAFDFANRLSAALGEEVERWRRDGVRAFYHYRTRSDLNLGYSFLEDARTLEPFPDVTIPVKVLHGTNDESVAPELTVRFARGKANVSVEWFDTDHQMLDVIDQLWISIRDFYEIACPRESRGGSVRSLLSQARRT